MCKNGIMQVILVLLITLLGWAAEAASPSGGEVVFDECGIAGCTSTPPELQGPSPEGPFQIGSTTIRGPAIEPTLDPDTLATAVKMLDPAVND